MLQMRRRAAWFLALLGACSGPGASPLDPPPVAPSAADLEPAAALPLAEISPWPAADAAEAFQRQARLDGLGAAQGYAALLRDAATALAAEADPGAAAVLADEVEFLAVRLLGLRDAIDRRLPAQLLDGVVVDPRHGMAWARLQELVSPRPGETLGMLQDWAFVGPFDNERGGGMRIALPPETDPAVDRVYAGREREIGWRRTPAVVHPRGDVPLGRLIRPDTQVAVLARTWIRVEDAVDAVLLLGVRGEVRAWLDGAPLVEALDPRALASDSLAAPLRLEAGWHELAVKVGSRTEGAALRARLVSADGGAPLDLASTGELPPQVTPAILSTDPAPERLAADRPGALGRLAAQGSEADAEAWLRRSVLERAYRVAPEERHPGRASARRAAELAPSDLRVLLQHARTLEPGNEDPEELDLNPWLHAVEAILAVDATQPTALVMLLDHAARWQHSQARTLELLARLSEAAPQSPVVPMIRAWAYRVVGLPELAPAEWRAALAHPALRFYPLHLRTAAQVLPRGSQEWLDALRTAAAGEHDFEALRTLAEHQRRVAGTTDVRFERAALALLQVESSWDHARLRESARRLLAAGESREADLLLDEATALCPDEPANAALHARIALVDGDTERAVRMLERLLELDFAAADERRLLDWLRATGGGSFEEQWFEPLDAVLARHPVADAGAGGHEILLYRTVVRVHPDGTTSTYRRKVARVLDANGVRQLDRQAFPYAWNDQDLRLLTAKVLRPDGSVEAAATGRGWSGSSVDLPPLSPGDVVDLEWRVDDLRTGIFGRYVGIDHAMTPDRNVPVAHSELVLLVPEELPLRFHAVGLENREPTVQERGELGTAYMWMLEDIAPASLEPGMPAAGETVPRVQASSYEDWQAFAAWWWNLIDDSIRASPEMRAKVAELTAGLDTPREKLRAIYDFVVTDIRYQAWEFGVHGYQPYTAPVIFSRGFGDCKDKAILLQAMLAEVGIEAWPVLIERSGTAQLGGLRSEEDLTLALVNHFNHCIAWLPAQDGIEEMWLDGTARLHPLEVLPYDDRGAQVLVVRDDGAERRRIPFADPDDDFERRTLRVAVAPDGSAEVDLEVAPHGRFDPRYRQAFATGEEQRRERGERLLGGWFGPLAGAPGLRLPDVEDLSRPLVYGFSAEARSLARKVESGLELPAAFDALDLLQGTAAQTERTNDLLFDGPWRRETVVEYVDLGAWRSGDLPADIEAETEDASYSWRVRRDDDVLRIEERFEVRTHRIPAARYAAFRELCRVVDEAQDADLLLTPIP